MIRTYKLPTIIKYIVIGIINNVANFLVFKICTSNLGYKPFIAASLGFMAGASISYELNSKYTFNFKTKSAKHFSYFIFSQILILVIFGLSVELMTSFFSIESTFSWLFSTILITLLNYNMQKTILFRENKK